MAQAIITPLLLLFHCHYFVIIIIHYFHILLILILMLIEDAQYYLHYAIAIAFHIITRWHRCRHYATITPLRCHAAMLTALISFSLLLAIIIIIFATLLLSLQFCAIIFALQLRQPLTPLLSYGCHTTHYPLTHYHIITLLSLLINTCHYHHHIGYTVLHMLVAGHCHYTHYAIHTSHTLLK